MNFYSEILNKKRIAILIFAIFFVILDRFFKTLAFQFYSQKKIELLGDFLKFNFVKNYNIAFSLPLSGIFLNILIFCIIVFLSFYIMILIKQKENNQAIYLTIILIGAISNYVDRILYGFVIDYIDLKYYTVFNFADIMIVSGVIMLILFNFKNKKKYV